VPVDFEIEGIRYTLPDDQAEWLAGELRRLALDDVEYEGTPGNAIAAATMIEAALQGETSEPIRPIRLELDEMYRILDVGLIRTRPEASWNLYQAMRRFFRVE
jgi:hypothetical protein